MLELIGGLIVAGVLFMLLSLAVRGVLGNARQATARQSLTAFIGAQQARYDLAGEWLTVGTDQIVDITIVNSTTASTNARTISMAADTSGGFARIGAAARDDNGDCLIWRAFESGAPTADIRLVVTDAACTGATALNTTTGVSW